MHIEKSQFDSMDKLRFLYIRSLIEEIDLLIRQGNTESCQRLIDELYAFLDAATKFHSDQDE